MPQRETGLEEDGVDAMYLAQKADNEAFLGIGVLGWILIIIVVLAVGYFLSRRRGRGL